MEHGEPIGVVLTRRQPIRVDADTLEVPAIAIEEGHCGEGNRSQTGHRRLNGSRFPEHIGVSAR